MFFDPVANQVLDYVGGEADLKNRRIRAIGDPRARFAEDKLRLLRAIRFTTRFGFELEAETLAAIRELAPTVTTVSAERIAEEIRKLLERSGAARGIELLRSSELLAHVLPEWNFANQALANEEDWQQMLAELKIVAEHDFRLGVAVILGLLSSKDSSPRVMALAIGQRWKLSNNEVEAIEWLVANQGSLVGAAVRPWSEVQPVLVHPCAKLLLEWTIARDRVLGRTDEDAEFSREKLSLPLEQLNPPPLLTGDDLIRNGWKPGREFARVITLVRAAQLDQTIHSFEEAMTLADQIRENYSA
jgi:poly(A) polymerase